MKRGMVKRQYVGKLIDIVIITYVLFNILFGNYSYESNRNIALIALYLSIEWLYKTHKSKVWFMNAIMLFYFNYSIITQEYMLFYWKIPAYMKYHTIDYYGIAINIFTVFLFIYVKMVDIERCMEIKFKTRSFKPLILLVIVVVLLLIFIFAIDRNIAGTYEVKITSIYEYAYLLFIIAFYYSNNSLKCNVFFMLFAMIFIIQDLYLGGRITSLQILLVLFYMNYNRLRIGNKKMVWLILIGIIIFNAVGVYRVNYSTNGLSVNSIVENIFEQRFVLDTAYNSYYSTITHIVARERTEFIEQVANFCGFFLDLIGINLDNYLYLTNYVRSLGIANIGGGWYASHFFFWFGWFGVIVGSMILVYITKTIMSKKNNLFNDLSQLQLITILSTFPRWYMYTPLSFFKGILLITILYILCERRLRIKW